MWLTTTYGEIPSETVAEYAGNYVTRTTSFGIRLAGLSVHYIVVPVPDPLLIAPGGHILKASHILPACHLCGDQPIRPEPLPLGRISNGGNMS